MNTAGVIRRVRSLFGDSNDIFLKQEDIIDWINDGQLEIARETQYKIVNDTSNTAGDFVNGFAVPSALLFRRVKYGERVLDLISQEAIDMLRMDEWPGQIPLHYFLESNVVKFWPLPEAGDTTPVLLSYVAAPTDLASEASQLDVPIKFHNDLVLWCIVKAHERNENWRAAEYYTEKFYSNIGQRRFEGMSEDDSYYQVASDPTDFETYGMTKYY